MASTAHMSAADIRDRDQMYRDSYLTYKSTIQDLALPLPEFDILTDDFAFNSRQDMICIDIDQKKRVVVTDIKPRFFDDSPPFPDWITSHYASWKKFTRILVIDALTPPVCFGLGSVLDLDPRVFVEHLNNQAPGFGASQIRPISSTRCSSWEKPFVSVRWLRPVLRLSSKSSLLRSRIDNAHFHSKPVSAERNADLTGERWSVSMIRPQSNILRSELDMPVVTTSPHGMAAIEERATIYPVTKYKIPFVVLLLDEVPKAIQWTFDTGYEPNTRSKPPHTCEPVIQNLYQDLVKRPTGRQEFWPMTERFKKRLDDEMPSTGSSLTSRLELSSQHVGHDLDSQTLPVHQILNFVRLDTISFLHAAEDVANTMIKYSASPAAELEDLIASRLLLGELQAELSTLRRDFKQSLMDLARLFPDESWSNSELDISEEIFERAAESLREASITLSGSLQFIESHRAITEAEGITRLTELAFLFIPLSFSTSLFSMQIQPLADPVPVWAFMAFALSLSAFTYLLRLLARSSWLHERKMSLENTVRKHSDISYGNPLPNTAFVAWLIGRYGKYALFYGSLLAILAIPLAVLWTQPLATSLQIAMTFVLIIVVFGVLWVAMYSARDVRIWLSDEFKVRKTIAERLEELAPTSLEGQQAQEVALRRPLKVRIAEWIARGENEK